MHDLKSQLRTYYHSVIWLRDPDEVIAGRTRGVTMAQELETLRTRRWWSQPAVGATAVALLALLMFGGGLLLGLRLGGGVGCRQFWGLLVRWSGVDPAVRRPGGNRRRGRGRHRVDRWGLWRAERAAMAGPMGRGGPGLVFRNGALAVGG